MAKSSKKKADIAKSDEKTDEPVIDVVDQDDADTTKDDSPEMDTPADIEDAEVIEETQPEQSVEPEPEAHEDMAGTATDEVTAPVPVTTVATESPRKGGFVPAVIGGLVAGGIGFGAATWLNMQNTAPDLQAVIDAQSARIDELDAQIAGLPTAPDLSPVEAEIAAVQTDLTDQLATLQTSIGENIAAFEDRLSEVEKRPGGDGTLSDTALAAYQRELDDLRAQLETQSSSVAEMAAQAEADLTAARAQAEEAEIEALVAARAANARAALNRISVAVETGEPFAAQLPDIEVVLDTIPAALSDAAETGVPSLATLQDEFTPAARAALATARAEGVADESGGIGAFLRSQFDVRSTAPREGSDPDAILSRAEAALRDGRLADALAEIAALPEVARAEMTDWTAKAQQRADVVSSIATLSETLNEN